MASRGLPGWVLAPLVWLGSAVAVAFMPAQRQASFEYLTKVLPRQPGWPQVVHHFYTFAHTLILVLRAGAGHRHPMAWAPGQGDGFMRVLRDHQSVLFGTFHLGHADLLGYLLGMFERPVRMVRVKVENSDDTELAEKAFGQLVRFLWVDQPENISFAIKEALGQGESIAIKCDRVEGARKTVWLPFLGVEREFPFTIYHFAILFQVPVLFSLGVDDGRGGTAAYAPEPFVPYPDAPKKAELARAEAHFRSVIDLAQDILRAHPYVWFNFDTLGESSRPEPRS